jgi:alpha-ketoglutarate-dependent sulfate ester dioxygenase
MTARDARKRDGLLIVRRLGYALGAEITGIDLSADLDAATVTEIRDAWVEHSLLCFPGQNLSPHSKLRSAGASARSTTAA